MEALREAYADGGLEGLEELLEQGVDVDAADEHGLTYLHEAGMNGLVDVFELLLAHGANVNATAKIGLEDPEDGFSILHSAVVDGKEEIVELLLDHGADLNIVDKFGNVPMEYVGSHRVPATVMEMLLDAGADPSRCYQGYGSVLYWASYYGQVEKVQLLLATSANVNEADVGGCAPLFVSSNGEVTKMLLEAGADVHFVYEEVFNRTSLHAASMYGRVDVMKVLLYYGASVDTVDTIGCQPIHMATTAGAVDLLLEHGADLYTGSGEDQRNLLHLACYEARMDVLEALSQRDDVCFHLFTKSGKTALRLACEVGRLEVLPVVLTRGEDADVMDKKGELSIHWAARRGKVQVVQTLLENGVDGNTRTKRGKTALHLAAHENRLETVEALLLHGVDTNIVDKAGWTPLHHASLCGHLSVVTTLVAHGVDQSIKDKGGKTALDLASSKRHSSVVSFLLGSDEDTSC